MKKILLSILIAIMLIGCMSVKPFPDVVSGDFYYSELHNRELVKCWKERAVIERIENRAGSKMLINYMSNSYKIDIPAAKWVGGNAYEGISSDGKKYVITMANYKDPYVLSIELNPETVIVVGLKCWGDNTIAQN